MTENKNNVDLWSPLLTTLFIGLKLTGHIDWSWLWVLSPAWGGFLVVFAILGLIGLLKHS